MSFVDISQGKLYVPTPNPSQQCHFLSSTTVLSTTKYSQVLFQKYISSCCKMKNGEAIVCIMYIPSFFLQMLRCTMVRNIIIHIGKGSFHLLILNAINILAILQCTLHTLYNNLNQYWSFLDSILLSKTLWFLCHLNGEILRLIRDLQLFEK